MKGLSPNLVNYLDGSDSPEGSVWHTPVQLCCNDACIVRMPQYFEEGTYLCSIHAGPLRPSMVHHGFLPYLEGSCQGCSSVAPHSCSCLTTRSNRSFRLLRTRHASVLFTGCGSLQPGWNVLLLASFPNHPLAH